jgi:hypothetical protein
LRSPPDSWPTFFCWSRPFTWTADPDKIIAAVSSVCRSRGREFRRVP